jgi:hypothetical protein
MERGVAFALDGLLGAVAREDERELRHETLDGGEKPVVQRELMDELRLDAARELGVDGLLRVRARSGGIAIRRRKATRPCQPPPSKNCAW